MKQLRLLFIIAISLQSIIALAQQRSYTASFIDKIDQIDSWALMSPASFWTRLATHEAAPQEVFFKAAWDSSALYFIIHLAENNITSIGDTNHQPLFKLDNCVELFLDIGADGKDYYELQVNAANIRWELSLDKAYNKGGQPTNPDELKGLKSDITIVGTLNQIEDTDQYWEVMITMPWASLQKYYTHEHLPDSSIPIALNLSRVVQEGEGQHYYTWSPMDKVNIHMPEQWGSLVLAR